MTRIFDSAEKDWLRLLSTDLVRWHNNEGKTPEFLVTASQHFFRKFPYRHPRASRYIPIEDRERGPTFYGAEYFGLREV